MGGSFGNTAYHSHHGSPANHFRNDVGDHHHAGKVVGSSGAHFSMKDREPYDDSDDGVSIGFGGSKDLGKVGGIEVKADPMQLPLGFTKSNEDNSEMKLDFAFHSELSQLTEEKAHGGGSVKSGTNAGGTGGGGGTIGGGMTLQRNMHVTSTLGTAAELNYKIAAVKTHSKFDEVTLENNIWLIPRSKAFVYKRIRGDTRDAVLSFLSLEYLC